MIAALLVATVLSVSDPAGDAVGDGSLRMPTALVFRTQGAFDARGIEVYDRPEFSFGVIMEALANPWDLPLGFSLPIIEVYLDAGGEEGQEELLPGSGMRLPEGRSWDFAFRITGDAFHMFQANPGGDPIDVTGDYAAELRVEDDTIGLFTALPRPDRFSLYGMVGGYDPFTESGWRPVLAEPTPFAFSSERQTLPVVDVIADSFELQVRAIESGVLPEIRAATAASGWLVAAGAGLLISLLGLGLRLAGLGRSAPEQPEPARRRYEPLPPPVVWPFPDPARLPALPPPVGAVGADWGSAEKRAARQDASPTIDPSVLLTDDDDGPGNAGDAHESRPAQGAAGGSGEDGRAVGAGTGAPGSGPNDAD